VTTQPPGPQPAWRFGYPDLGEVDAGLRRLSVRNERIRSRDTLGAANAGAALAARARCHAAVDAFAARVYRTESAGTTARSE
jgi:hypothetical protein